MRLNAFLTRNGYPHQSLDTESDPDADGFLRCFELGRDDLPVVVADGQALRNPTNAALADAIGLTSEIDLDHRFDLIVVGAGPAGLAAGVYAASEGLDTAIIEGVAPGGQAGTSSKIENYLGFPTGISGQALAGRAQTQAQKFGARILVSRAVAGLDRAASGDFRLTLDDGRTLAARSVIAATGARYRRLPVEGLSDWGELRRPLRRDRDGGEPVPGPRGGGGRRRQLGRPGGGVPLAPRRPRPHAGAGRRA